MSDWLAFWYEALHATHGVVVESDNPERVIQLLYQARAKAGDEALSSVSIAKSPANPSYIFLYKRVINATEKPTDS